MAETVIPEVTVLHCPNCDSDLWVVAHETVRKSGRIRATFDHIIDQMTADNAYFTRGAASVL